MSAPWESFVGKDGKVWWDNLGKRKSATVRYLRADLVCGECGHLREDSDYSVLCTKHSWEIAAENPACMAFAPKEER